MSLIDLSASLRDNVMPPLRQCACGGSCWWCRPWHKSNRSATDNTPPLPGAAAERPIANPRTGVDTEATGTPVAGNYSTDRRNAA